MSMKRIDLMISGRILNRKKKLVNFNIIKRGEKILMKNEFIDSARAFEK